MRKSFQLIVLIVFAFVTLFPSSPIYAEVTTATNSGLYHPVPQVVTDLKLNKEGRHRVIVKDFGSINDPGNPDLPLKVMNFVLPENVHEDSVSVQLVGNSAKNLMGTYSIIQATPVRGIDGTTNEWGEGKDIVAGKNMNVYGKDQMYPQSHIEILNVGSCGSQKIVQIAYYPFCYNPVQQTLRGTLQGNIHISYTVNTAFKATVLDTPHTAMDSFISQITENYQPQVTTEKSSFLGGFFPQFPKPDTDDEPVVDKEEEVGKGYLILTTSKIKAQSGAFKKFVDHKSNRFKVTVATPESWGGGVGDQAADNIRKYLRKNYKNKNLKYVLIIGSPDPKKSQVPMKMIFPHPKKGGQTEAPTDFYYSELTSNWDRDKDGRYGEWWDDYYKKTSSGWSGPDRAVVASSSGIDLFPEVFVGRIPCYVYDESTTYEKSEFYRLSCILKKIINYENGVFNGAWMNEALLSMEPSNRGTPGYHLGNSMKRGIFNPNDIQTTHISDFSHASDISPCNIPNVLESWQQGVGYHMWWTHGSAYRANGIMKTEFVPQLDDSYPSIVFQGSCLNARPEIRNNLSYRLLHRGAIAAVGATRISWYTIGQTSYAGSWTTPGMCYDYTKNIVSRKMSCGESLAMVRARNSDLKTVAWVNVNVYNLYGDPSLKPGVSEIFNKPLAKITTSVNSTQPQKITFDASASQDKNGNAGMKKYFWDFGDGAYSNACRTTHVYTNTTNSDKTFKVKLTVTNFANLTATVAKTVTIPAISTSTVQPFITITSPVANAKVAQYVTVKGKGVGACSRIDVNGKSAKITRSGNEFVFSVSSVKVATRTSGSPTNYVRARMYDSAGKVIASKMRGVQIKTSSETTGSIFGGGVTFGDLGN